MTIYKEFNLGGGKGNPLGSFGPVVVLILGIVLLYFIAKGIFTLLSWLAIPLFIGALIIDYTVVTDFVKFVFKLLKENPLMGIVAIVLTAVGHSVVSAFLFFRALMRRQMKKVTDKIKQEKEPEFTEYEEVKEDEDFLELPEAQKQTSRGNSNEYDGLFE